METFSFSFHFISFIERNAIKIPSWLNIAFIIQFSHDVQRFFIFLFVCLKDILTYW